MESKNICPICLRTNRNLKVIPTALSEYHDELTNYSLPLKNTLYCSECECLLRKTYNFQQKCNNAAKILKNWMNLPANDKPPANMLHLKLPPISLCKSTSKNDKVFNYTWTDPPVVPILIEKRVFSEPLKATREEDIKSIKTFKKEPDYQFIEVSEEDPSLPSFEHYEDITNVLQIEFKQEENSDDSVRDIPFHIEGKTNKRIDKNIKVEANNKSFFTNTEEDLEQMSLNKDDYKNEYTDNARLKKSDNSEHPHVPQKKAKMEKKINDELANIDDDDLDDDGADMNERKGARSTDFNIHKLLPRAKVIVSKLEGINQILDSVVENWQVTSLLTDMKTTDKQTKDELKKKTRTFLTERRICSGRNARKRNVLAKVRLINADLDLVNEMCFTTVDDYKTGLCGPKERLKAKLEKWGELKTKDGYVFDKDTIINSLDMVSDRYLLQLLNSMDGKKHLSPSAVKILKMIPGKQQLNNYESVFDIQYLTTEKEKLEEFERRKTYECYVNAAFKCEICYQGFTAEGYLEYHKKSHDESRPFECHICHVRHLRKKGVSAHVYSHDVVYKCKLCPLVTYYRDSMINHYKQHKGTVYGCEKCGKIFKSKSAYVTHQSHVHPRGDHVCSACGGAYISLLGLKMHMFKKHRGEPTEPADGSGFSCDECDLTFPSEEVCAKHRRRTHGVKKIRTKLSKEKKKLTKLGKTKSVSTKPSSPQPRRKPIMTCPECNAVGHYYGWLVKHFNIEHPTLDVTKVYADRQIFLCDVCGKGFTTKCNLREHIGSRHSDVRIPCPSCAKQFPTQEKLRQHQVWHGPPTHCCDHCQKKFHTFANLYNHKRSHIGDRCFKCQICGKGFLHRAALREHIRGVHYHERRARKRGATDPSLGVTHPSHGVTHPSHGVTHPSHGVSHLSHVVSDTGALEITVVEAETSIGS